MIAWLLAVAGAVMLMQSVLFGRWALARVSYTRTFGAEAVFAGDTAEMIEVIDNAKPLPVFWLRAESTISANLRFQIKADLDIDRGKATQHHKSLFTLLPYRRIRRRHQVYCASRGVYRLESVSLSAGDLFGLSVTTRSVPTSAVLTVYPQLLPLHEVPLPSRDWQGQITVRRWIVDDPFIQAGVREYRAGDEMRRINWKAVARTSVLQVNKHDYTADRKLYLYVNVEVTEQMRGIVSDEALIEKGISYAATLAAEAVAAGLPVGFAHNAHSLDKTDGFVNIEARGGREHLLAIFEAMARMEMRHRYMFHDLLSDGASHGGERRDYVIITAHVSDAILERMERLRSLGHGVYLIRLEKEAEEGGRT